MRIAIDCLRVNPAYVGGVTSYTLGLLGGFGALATPHTFEIYATAANRHLFEPLVTNSNFALSVLPKGHELRDNLARASALAGPHIFNRTSNVLHAGLRQRIDAGCDLLYVPSVTLPFFDSARPTLLSIHDIQHLHYPEFFDRFRLRLRTCSYAVSARSATWLQASSEFIRQDLLTHYPGLDPERIAVIPEGVDQDTWGRAGNHAIVRDRYSLPERFLLYPAQLWPHKNHITVLRALRELRDREQLQIPLILTGASFSATDTVLQYIRQHGLWDVHYLGKVPFSDLIALVQMSSFLITAVLYESSSLPVLEAAAAGTPVIASDTPPNRELARKLKLNLFSPLNATDLAGVIIKLWHDPALATAQATHNRSAVAYYGWANAAARFLSTFEGMVTQC